MRQARRLSAAGLLLLAACSPRDGAASDNATTTADTGGNASAGSLDAAVNVVKSYYAKADQHGEGDHNVDPATFSPDLIKAFAADAEKHKGEEGSIDFDIRSGSQDPEIKGLTFTSDTTDTGAKVTAHFNEFGHKMKIAYLLDFVAGAWKISDIKAPKQAGVDAWDVKKLLAVG